MLGAVEGEGQIFDNGVLLPGVAVAEAGRVKDQGHIKNLSHEKRCLPGGGRGAFRYGKGQLRIDAETLGPASVADTQRLC